MRRLGLVLLALLIAATSLSATGTVTVTTSADIGINVVRVTAAWTSHTDGTVTGNAFAMPGRLMQIEFVPNTSTTQPTDLYDVVIGTAESLNILNDSGTNRGANLSNATPLLLVFSPPLLIDSNKTLDIQITNAGSGKTGTIRFWVQR